jgi:protein-disulfide isomerase
MKKPNTQTIIIIALGLVVVGFAFNEWGREIIPGIKYRLIGESEKDRLQIGDANAKIGIIEYYSYACEYCREFESGIRPEINKDYVLSGKVRWIFRPIDSNLGSAVLCADDQGKFLEYHDYLFEKAPDIKEEEDLKTFAKNIGIDEEIFWQCYSSGKYETLITGWYNDLVLGFKKYKISEGEQGTPAFLIGDKMITGIQPYNVIAGTIEGELAK